MNKNEQENAVEAERTALLGEIKKQQIGKGRKETLTFMEWAKKTTIILVGIIIVIFAIFFCLSMYNDKIAIDSVVSLMLAFFLSLLPFFSFSKQMKLEKTFIVLLTSS